MPLFRNGLNLFLLSSAQPVGLSDFTWRLMRAEDRRFTLRNLKILAAIAAAMVSFFAVLDYFTYPAQQALFSALRWTCASLVMVLLLALRSRVGKYYFRPLTIILPLIPALVIAITIYVTRDPASVYYAGLSLCIVATGFLFHWTYREVFAVSGMVLILYLLACLPAILDGLTAMEAAGLFSNLIFLVATGGIVFAASYAHNQMRIEQFRTRQRLRQQKFAFRETAIVLRKTLHELEDTEGELIQSGKMASLGQLSASVIHEIGNPLNHSNQALFMLRRRLQKLSQDKEVQEAVEDIQDSVDRMKEIVRELREFSHKRSEELAPFTLLEAIHASVRMLRSELDGKEIFIGGSVPPNLKINGVKNQLTQVLVNLIHNAIQAMGEIGNGEIRITASEKNGEVLISVTDNGPGIPESIRAHIFDPFFSTKKAGDGTGLGLSICYRIVRAHSGTIRVLSDGQSHTEFQLQFPAVRDSEEALVVSLPSHTSEALAALSPLQLSVVS